MPSHEIFTPDLINALTPDKRQEIHSAHSHPGLQIVISSNGRRYWAVQYRLHGATVRPKILDVGGNVSWDGINEAWEIARRYRRLASEGRDPIAERASEIRSQVDRNLTVAYIWAKYCASPKYRNLRSDSRGIYEDAYRRYVLPALGERLMRSLRLRDLVDAYNLWTDSGTLRLGMGRHALIVMRNLWTFGERYELLPADVRSPFLHLGDELPNWNSTRVREVDVPRDRIPELWRLTYDLDETRPLGAAIRFALLTGLRKSEIAKLSWDEIDIPDAKLHIPAARMKSKRDFIAPLHLLAMRELYTLKYARPDEEPWNPIYVFGRMTASMLRASREATGALDVPRRHRPLAISSDLPLGDPNPKLTQIAAKVGCTKRITMHALRKTFARECLVATDYFTVKRLLGHSMGTDVTAGYLLEDFSTLRAKAEAIANNYLEILGDAYQWSEPDSNLWRMDKELGRIPHYRD